MSESDHKANFGALGTLASCEESRKFCGLEVGLGSVSLVVKYVFKGGLKMIEAVIECGENLEDLCTNNCLKISRIVIHICQKLTLKVSAQKFSQSLIDCKNFSPFVSQRKNNDRQKKFH